MERTHLLSVSAQGDLAVLQDAEFIQQRLFVGTLARVPLGGGAPRPLLERVRDADWAPGNEGGERLAILREVEGQDRLGRGAHRPTPAREKRGFPPTAAG